MKKKKKKKNMRKIIMLQLSARIRHVHHSPGVFKMDPAEVVIRSVSTRVLLTHCQANKSVFTGTRVNITDMYLC